MYSNGSITLKADEVYYIAIKGGDGGAGGAAWRVYHDEARFVRKTVYPGYTGALTFYEVEVMDDTIISLYRGTNGSSGGNAPGLLNERPESSETGKGGIGGTTDGFSTGAGSPGSDGVSGIWWVDFGKRDTFYYRTSGGGGGGSASVITFNNDNNMTITANGGNGRTGDYTIFTQDDEDGWWYKIADEDGRGNGGSGGSITQNFDNIPGVKVRQLSSAEGAARIKTPTSSGAVIRKQRKSTDNTISVKDLMVGEHIILSNSIDNATTTFRKTDNDYEFEHYSGSYRYNNGSYINLEWSAFSKYAISGSGSASNMKILVKSDLKFVGGDGSAIFPYYPEPAGSISSQDNSGGGVDKEDFDMLVNSIISVSSMIEKLDTTIVEQNEQDNSVGEFKPFTLEIKTINGATVTKNNNVNVHAKVVGRATNEIMYKIFINGEETNDYETFPGTNIINVNDLVNGYNNIMIMVRDTLGNTQSDIINIWAVD